jgi:hypothetical protein
VLGCASFGNGHINDTYRLKTDSGEFILQRVNKNVFRTNELVENYQVLVHATKNYQSVNGTRLTPKIFKNKKGDIHHIDEDGFAWRLVELIADAVSYDICPDPDVAFRAAKAVGRYQLFLNTLQPSSLKETIVGFHNLPSRFADFKKTIDQADSQLLQLADKEVKETLGFEFLVKETSGLLQNLPVRINHNDTKLNNVIFSAKDVLVIDLDTVMPGSVLFDFGDMVRTFTSPVAEDEKDISKTEFRPEFFEALTKGYLRPLKSTLLKQEKENLLAGSLYIIYEQVLRFLTDYLKGNVYYKVDFFEHNLVRSRTQLKLLKSIVASREKLEKIVLENG